MSLPIDWPFLTFVIVGALFLCFAIGAWDSISDPPEWEKWRRKDG